MAYPGADQSSLPADATATCLGTVLAVQANFYWVKLQDQPVSTPGRQDKQEDDHYLLCTRRARLKKIGQQVMVGDQVAVDNPDFAGGRGAISQVLPRRNLLDRPPVANVDQILLLFALTEPDLDPYQMSRFLLKAEATDLRICLCLNKQDLVPQADWQSWEKRLQQWGYDPIIISAGANWGLDRLAHQLSHCTTVISGPSGVGKSSLINRLIPDIELKTNEVSGKLGRGRHTTRHVELFELPKGGLLADTPGFNQPDLHLSPHRLATYFPEIRQQIEQKGCQFSNCLHRDEPGCAIDKQWERYKIYLTVLDEALDYQKAQNQRRDEEDSLKVKVGQMGQLQHEPKLLAKKYRRVSRRSQNQALQDFCDSLPDSVDQLDQLSDFDFDGAD